MHLVRFFLGVPLRLRSTLSAAEVAERINRFAGSRLSPFATGIVGGVWLGRVRLCYRSSIFEYYNVKPILAGRLTDSPGGARLDLRYRASAAEYIFFPAYYLFLGWITTVLPNGLNPDLTEADKLFVLAIFVVLCVGPLIMHAFGTRNADKELNELIDFLWRNAEAIA